ncbi:MULTISPECIES: type II/IV secretion system ATPase subunit [unclassified Methanoculleus]|jgi:flagellar protein FlaI|uniref:ATPase, T2SS/T4P/T4SS family n=2 Tax=Methanoculleus TaxID=45989 RepID=A0ABD8AAA7_9EURY|nr:ATPase, T2SS/T4P/T4SS family [Methanoculleus sp. UBA377]MDD2472369.1 ATPase, T2SS/T4P/T4SS family [Methanoculleus sp.]WOX56040.1 ATPase, T2SS/T4P/T4SS family [Methanoculleus palmolei]
MRANEDEERELITAVRNLLAQSGKPVTGNEDTVTGIDSGKLATGADESVPPSPPNGETAQEEAVPVSAGSAPGETEERPTPSSGGWRTGGGENLVRSLLERIERQKSGVAKEAAVSPSRAAGDAGTRAGAPLSSAGRNARSGIFDRMRGLKDADAPDPSDREDSGAATVDEPGPDEDLSIGVVSVDDLGNLADLILPKSATFTVEELNLTRNEHHFDFVDNARVVSEFDDLFSRALSTATLAAAAAQAAPADEAPQSRLGFLTKLHLPKATETIEEYDPALHGPLVDLAMRPSPGLEEIELYPVNEPYAYVRVTYDGTTREYTYSVIEPVLTPGELELFEEIKERLFETLDVTTRNLTRDEALKALRDAANAIIADYGIHITPPGREKVLYHVEKEFLGDGLIDPIMHDKYIEDISCDGVNSPIFVYHTTYESMKTSLIYQSATDLDSFVTKLAQRAGKYISIAEPMLDATMSDGSRIQMTLGSEVTAHGSTFTIRKFREEPITPTDLIEWHTFSPLGIAFIWLAVENAKSCIFAGGTASGKTTTLNAISLFIPPLAKIVTLEDTRELKLPHPNWIPSITRDSFSQDGRGEIDMYELLRAALRQRPEYILVGEVRGREALTLFQAMSTGHVTYATMHADSVASAVHRLENPPIDVPRNMLSALSLMSIQVQARIGGQRIRRNKQLIEILDIDPRTNELITNEVFRWYPATDEIRYSGKSYILEQIMEDRGWSEERMQEELKRRQEVLEWMRIKKIRYFRDVSKILVSYFRDPEAVVERVRADLYGEGGAA